MFLGKERRENREMSATVPSCSLFRSCNLFSVHSSYEVSSPSFFLIWVGHQSRICPSVSLFLLSLSLEESLRILYFFSCSLLFSVESPKSRSFGRKQHCKGSHLPSSFLVFVFLFSHDFWEDDLSWFPHSLMFFEWDSKVLPWFLR
jgi:hypothetical protein